MHPPYSILNLIDQCDSFPYPSHPNYDDFLTSIVHFRIAAHPHLTLGLMLPSVAATFENLPDWSLDVDSTPRTLTLLAGTDVASRSAAMNKTVLAMKATGHFRILEKWRNEQYGVYGRGGELLFSLERASSQLFGVVTYGVHITAFYRTPDTREYRIWVPRRAKTKENFPGMLDNSIAGGLSVTETPFECLIREGDEEASVPRQVMEKTVVAGAVTYFYISGPRSGGEEGLLQPECQFVYDLDLTTGEGEEDVVLKPKDGEVDTFHTMSVPEVRKALANGEFKPNSALVLIEFLIRHGFIKPEEEKDYLEILSRVHRRLEFPLLQYSEVAKKES
jgi:8-oxo-dGTP pyrophosphatase MutT (NUDIX family)